MSITNKYMHIFYIETSLGNTETLYVHEKNRLGCRFKKHCDYVQYTVDKHFAGANH